MTAGAKVLIVDDRDIVRETLRDILVDFDCTFTEANKGEKALDLFREREFDVIFLDLKLPDVSGMEVLRGLRRLGVAPGKVIILTGLPDPVTKAEVDSLGAWYLTKPLEWVAIRQAFAAALADSELPLAAPEPKRKEEPRRAGAARRRTRAITAVQPGRDRRPHLLVLDDDPSWLDTLEQVLGEEFDLTLTTSPKEACRRARREPFSLVVLDKQLPGGVSGLDILIQMRRAAPNLRAIILTGFPEQESDYESGRALVHASKGNLVTLFETVERILAAENSHLIRVFLCYDRMDMAKVSHLFWRLTNRGYLPWMELKSIIAGRWEPQIQKAINEADYFVFCFSSRTRYNDRSLRKELQHALERQHSLLPSAAFFIPARLEDSEIAKPFQRFHYVDLFRRNGFDHLLETLSSERPSDN